MPARGGEGRRDGGREQATRGARRDPRWGGGEEGNDAQRRWREDAIAMGAHDELQLRCMHVVARYTTANLSHETPANLVQQKSWNSRQIGVCVFPAFMQIQRTVSTASNLALQQVTEMNRPYTEQSNHENLFGASSARNKRAKLQELSHVKIFQPYNASIHKYSAQAKIHTHVSTEALYIV